MCIDTLRADVLTVFGRVGGVRFKDLLFSLPSSKRLVFQYMKGGEKSGCEYQIIVELLQVRSLLLMLLLNAELFFVWHVIQA